MRHPPSDTRILSLDILRGLALLGILVMNIQVFSMPFAAYMNPTAFGDFSGINRYIWGITHIFAEGKFVTLFTIMFGAGVNIFIDNARKNNRGRYLTLHYRRTLALLTFGLFHAYFIWFGDILVLYGMCALILCFFVELTAARLLIIGIVLNLLLILAGSWQGEYFRGLSAAELAEMTAIWTPTGAALEQDIAALTGTIGQIHQFRIHQAYQQQVVSTGYAISILGTMMAGMALYRWGVLSAQKSPAFYRKLIVYGLLISLPLIIIGIITSFDHQWDIYYAMGPGKMFNMVGAIAMAMSYIGVVMLAVQRQWLPGWQKRLAAVGQMAFSNYIAQSLICTFIFYGHGLGLYGQLDRLQQLWLVFAIWALQLWYSPLWLARYRFGPLEWLWRSLTYGKRQPFAK